MVGDLHGNVKSTTTVLNEMGKRKISHVIVLGDFGLWGGHEGHIFLDACQSLAEKNKMSLFAIPGNHENYDILERYQESYPTHKGFTYLRSRVLMCGKVNHFTLANKRFVVAGGAVSIDREWRLAKERGGIWSNEWGREDLGHGTGSRTLWWPQEQLTDKEELAVISGAEQPVDYLLTHDASDSTPWKNRLKPDRDSQVHRARIDRIVKAVKPKMHFHGHFHEKYDWINEGYDWSVQTYGLECNADWNSWGILDTETDEFAFRGEGMNFRSLES